MTSVIGLLGIVLSPLPSVWHETRCQVQKKFDLIVSTHLNILRKKTNYTVKSGLLHFRMRRRNKQIVFLIPDEILTSY